MESEGQLSKTLQAPPLESQALPLSCFHTGDFAAKPHGQTMSASKVVVVVVILCGLPFKPPSLKLFPSHSSLLRVSLTPLSLLPSLSVHCSLPTAQQGCGGRSWRQSWAGG